MKTSVLDIFIARFYPQTKDKINDLIADSILLKKLTDAAYTKLESSIQYYADISEQIKYIILILNDWANKNYTNINEKKIILGILVLLYFVSPIDIIPDFIPFIGKKDDIFLLKKVSKGLDKEILKYKQWRKANF